MRSAILLLLAFAFTNLGFATDCKMFMSKKDRVEILEEKQCQITMNNSTEELSGVDICLATMNTAYGVKIVRLVLEGVRNNKYNPRKLLIVEKRADQIINEGGEFIFTQDYFNPKDLKSSRFDVSMSADHSSVKLSYFEGRFGVKLINDLQLECH